MGNQDYEEFINQSVEKSNSNGCCSIFQVIDASRIAIASTAMAVKNMLPNDVEDEALNEVIKKALQLAVKSIS